MRGAAPSTGLRPRRPPAVALDHAQGRGRGLEERERGADHGHGVGEPLGGPEEVGRELGGGNALDGLQECLGAVEERPRGLRAKCGVEELPGGFEGRRRTGRLRLKRSRGGKPGGKPGLGPA